MAKVSAGVLEQVINYLDANHADEMYRRKLELITASGIAYIDGKMPAPMDYENDQEAMTILLEYCRYMRDNALDVFENNYLGMILDKQNKERVKAYEAAQDAIPG